MDADKQGMRPHYGPGRALIAVALVLGPWAMVPALALLAGRLVYLGVLSDPA